MDGVGGVACKCARAVEPALRYSLTGACQLIPAPMNWLNFLPELNKRRQSVDWRCTNR
jgi:hypothetical protein